VRAGWLKPWLLWLLVLGALCPVGLPRARADDSVRASTQPPTEAELGEARALFQRGVALADQRQFVAAAQRFREALAIHYAPAVAYNLGAALFELQQYDASFDQVQTVLRDGSTSPDLRRRAEKLDEALSTHVARLTVLASSSSGDAVVVRVDGQVIDPTLLGMPRAVSPGTHRVSAERSGQRVSERAIEVPARTAVIVDVSLTVSDPSTVAAAAESGGSAPKALDESARRRRIWLWTGIAAGVVVLATGVTLGVVLSRDDPASRPAAQGDFMPGVLTWK
jgi:hypothetical protein